MSTNDTHLNNDFTYRGPLAARMACHMGDFRPAALCNILGDQPLFYIDYVDHEDADLLDASLLSESTIPPEYYADNIDELRRRMARLESASQHIDAYGRENVETAFDAACARLGHSVATLTLADVEATIAKSRLTSAMYEDAKGRGMTIAMSAHVDTASYDRDAMRLNVNPRIAAPVAILAITRALRQAWLHMNGASINPLRFAPEEAVLLNRIQQADLAVSSIRAAWEQNLAGEKTAWARILTGSAYDLAVGFAREAIADFRALNNGNAGHAAFERWFFSGRCKDVDRKLIQSMLADHHGLVFDNPQVSKMVSSDLIARTGDMPVGKNYLSGLVDVILSDPLFTEVRDRSNANFLWFIKFERSFRATEGELEQNLQDVPQIPAGAVQGASNKEKSDVASASIVSFTGPTRNKGGMVQARKTGTNGVATVYYIDHFLSLPTR